MMTKAEMIEILNVLEGIKDKIEESADHMRANVVYPTIRSTAKQDRYYYYWRDLSEITSYLGAATDELKELIDKGDES